MTLIFLYPTHTVFTIPKARRDGRSVCAFVVVWVETNKHDRSMLKVLVKPPHTILSHDRKIQHYRQEIDTFFVHPCSGYLLSKHIVCSKKEAKKYKSRFPHVAKQNDLFNTPCLFHPIQNNDVVYVHTDPQMIRYFLETIVPYLKKTQNQSDSLYRQRDSSSGASHRFVRSSFSVRRDSFVDQSEPNL